MSGEKNNCPACDTGFEVKVEDLKDADGNSVGCAYTTQRVKDVFEPDNVAMCPAKHVYDRNKFVMCPQCEKLWFDAMLDAELEKKGIYKENVRAARNEQKVRPSWDSIWMGFAETIAQRSTCTRAEVGCVIVSDDNSLVLGLGYNGGAKGQQNSCISDEPGKCGHLHAEINALIKTNYRDGSVKKAYITTSPCYNCAVALVNAGIAEVIFRVAYRDQTGVALLSNAGVKVRQLP